MAFSKTLEDAGHKPESIATSAEVSLERGEAGFAITSILLNTEAKVPGIDEETFQKIAEGAKNGCLVSKALAGVEITLSATLV